MGFLNKAVVLIGEAFKKAGDAFDKVFLGADGIRSESAAAEFEVLNFFAKEKGLNIIVKEKGQGVDKLPETTMRVLIEIPHKNARFHSCRKLAIDIDFSTEESAQDGFKALKRRFYIEAAKLKPDALPHMSAELK